MNGEQYPSPPGTAAKRPAGTATIAKRAAKEAAEGATNPVANDSKQYTSNFINEEFNLALNKALGIL